MASTSSAGPSDAQLIRDLAAVHDRLTEQIGRTVIGQKDVVEQLLMAVFGRGHCLVVGAPGLAKSLLAATLGRVLGLTCNRVPFTSDLTAADVTGGDLVQEDPNTGRRQVTFRPGPLFANLFLAEDLTAAPPRTQAAVLEALQEEAVAAGGQTYRLPDPFLVLATTSPIERKGTHPLSPAQKDRFMYCVHVGYPSRAEEIQITKATTAAQKVELVPVLAGKQVSRFQEVVRQVVAADRVFAYAADLVRATRPAEPTTPKFVPQLVSWGAGPRACHFLIQAGRARAALAGRVHVTTDDIRAVAHPVLRHRLGTTFHADAEGVTADDVITRVLATVAVPADAGSIKGRKS